MTQMIRCLAGSGNIAGTGRRAEDLPGLTVERYMQTGHIDKVYTNPIGTF